MILVDTGPFVALFDPRDGAHKRCKTTLQSLRESLWTTVPVLTESFHMLDPGSLGARRLRDFVLQGGVAVWPMEEMAIRRAFELMEQYEDRPMDLAAASLITAAEALPARQIFTLDRGDFAIYRVRRGQKQEAMEILG
ncbi:MAG TPA: PIN domain-containing protein [Thermoanaerobaculia bacterium]|jgi:predicted nucleic acid-binding protein|nr:PIN domain-containing protein [Thermoanaerobaculia bacterium]